MCTWDVGLGRVCWPPGPSPTALLPQLPPWLLRKPLHSVQAQRRSRFQTGSGEGAVSAVTRASLGVCSLSAQNRVSSPGAGGPRAVATAGNQGGGQDRVEAGAEPGRASRGVYGEGGVNSGFRCGMPELKAESTEDSDGRFWDRVHRVKGLGSGW